MKNYCLTLSYDDVSMELMNCYEIDYNRLGIKSLGRLRVKLLSFLGSDLGLNVLHRPSILLLLRTNHPEDGLNTLGLPRGVHSSLLPNQVLILVFVVCLWCNLRNRKCKNSESQIQILYGLPVRMRIY